MYLRKLLLKILYSYNNLLSKGSAHNYFAFPEKKNGTKTSTDRSIVFFGEGSYYSFFYLAQALRKRGWKATSVSLTPPNSRLSMLGHGYDINLYDKDTNKYKSNIQEFLNVIVSDYKMIHFYSSLMIWNNYINNIIPLDIVYLKSNGIKIGYTPSGCREACTQSRIYEITGGICNKCIWQNNFQMCSDQKNENSINMVQKLADFISYEEDGNLGISLRDHSGQLVSTEPLLYALDPDHWKLDLDVPNGLAIKRKTKKHLIVLTAFYNQSIRANSEKDIKGMKAMNEAIDRLIQEGFPIQHVHTQDVPSKDVRYIQAQADIIIDQLNYGRYGAFAREGMMLAKPVICKIDYLDDSLPNQALKECPLIYADENSIYSVLKNLVQLSDSERKKIGEQSRKYMMKWHAADQCAARFEKMYDILMENKASA
jgi:hypothetical protein